MTKQERVAVGQRLRQQRNRLNLTREQFAELADIGAWHGRRDCCGRRYST